MSVNPNDPNQQSQNAQNAGSNQDNLMMSPAQTSIPQANPIDSTALGFNQLSRTTMQGDQALASKAGSSGASEAGSILGDIGKVAGAVLPFLAQGGFVGDKTNGYADGGQVAPQGNDVLQRILGLGYVIGALHQRDYGGTPDTLQQAAQEVKDHIAGGMQMAENAPSPANNSTAAMNAVQIGKEVNPYTGSYNTGRLTTTQALRDELKAKGLKGFADGGPTMDSPASSSTAYGSNLRQIANETNYAVPMSKMIQTTSALRKELSSKGLKGFATGGPASPFTDSDVAEQNLMQALGLGQNQSNAQQQPQSNLNQPQVPNSNSTQNVPNAGSTNNIGLQDSMASGNPNAMRGYATGGPSMPPQDNTPPLKPGQTFQGDGSVKGPGGPTDDLIPAKLSNGEFVMSAPATAFFGVDKLTQMNEKGKQGFMQAKGQVDANQQQPPGAGPPQGQPPMGAPPPQAGPPGQAQMPPMPPQAGMARGGVVRTKNSGYCGM